VIYNPHACSEKREFPDDFSAGGRTPIQLLETHSQGSAFLTWHVANISF